MSDEVIWRKANEADVPALAKVHHESWHESNKGLSPGEFILARTYDRFLGRWEAYLQDERRPTIVATIESELVGLLRYCADGEILKLYVSPKARRKKVADTLVYEAELDLSRVGNTHVRAQAMEAYEPARRFYESRGYEVVDAHDKTQEGFTFRVVDLAKPVSV